MIRTADLLLKMPIPFIKEIGAQQKRISEQKMLEDQIRKDNKKNGTLEVIANSLFEIINNRNFQKNVEMSFTSTQSMVTLGEKKIKVRNEYFFFRLDAGINDDGDYVVRIGVLPQGILPSANISKYRDDMGGYASDRIFYFKNLYGSKLEITSRSGTHQAYSQKFGFGKGFVLCSHEIIRAVLNQYATYFNSSSCEAVITDASQSSDGGTAQSGWTTEMANRLGYKFFASRGDLKDFGYTYEFFNAKNKSTLTSFPRVRS